ncbi:hypothetical protein Tco_0758309 [Tanacetum coccineum]
MTRARATNGTSFEEKSKLREIVELDDEGVVDDKYVIIIIVIDVQRIENKAKTNLTPAQLEGCKPLRFYSASPEFESWLGQGCVGPVSVTWHRLSNDSLPRGTIDMSDYASTRYEVQGLENEAMIGTSRR